MSNRSRIWKTKTPPTTSSIITSAAVDSSTTSGMPATPTAARISPFSMVISPTTCRMALRRVIIISMPSSTTDKRQRQVLPRDGPRPGGDRQHHQDGQRHQRHAGDHARADAEGGLHRAVQVEPAQQGAERQRDQHRLGDEGDERGEVELRRILHHALPGGGGGQDARPAGPAR